MNFGTKKEALLVFLLLAFTYAYFYHDPGWNGNSRLGLTFAMVEEGRLTIDSYHNQEETATKDKAIYNGHYYTTKAIGSSLVAVLFYFPLYKLENLLNVKLALSELKYVLTFFSIGLPSALAGSLMYVLCKQVTGNRFRSYMSTIAINLGTMIFPYSVIFFAHQLAGALLFCAFFLIFQLNLEPNYRRKGILFLIGFLLGYALITEYPVAPIVLVLIAYFFYTVFKTGTANRSLAVIPPALGACIPIALTLAYSTSVFGNPISTGYTHSAVPEFQEQQSQALVGIGWPNPKAIFFMTMHPAFGLFWQSPVLIVALIGVWLMWRVSQYRVEALVSIAAFCSLIILYSGFYNWWGGWTFGPRYIIPMLTFLCLPLTLIPKRWFSSVVILGLISIMQMFIAVSSLILIPDDFYKQIGNLGYFAYSSIYSYCLHRLLDGEFSTNLGNKFFGLHMWTGLIPPLVIILIVTLAFLVRRDATKGLQSMRI
jgi:hypothetical protein